jgi:FAD/FMN-containing dehydrogenase
MQRVTASHRQDNPPLVPPGAIDHHVNDMTVTVAADVTLAQLQTKLAAQNQWLPIDGGGDETVSALVLRNSTGPLRLGYGAWRDVLLGAQFTNGRGELISAGGRVLKNVAGYDLTKLLIGSGGVFGTPFTITARTWQRPAESLHVSLKTDVAENLTAIIASPLRPHWMMLTRDALTFGYHGNAAAMSLFLDRAAALNPVSMQRVSLEEDFSHRETGWFANPAVRISAPPQRVLALVNALDKLQTVADPAFGIILVPRGDPNLTSIIQSAALQFGATVLPFDSGGALSSVTMPQSTYALLTRLKTEFDPKNILPPLPPNHS